jgi:hypothetical protein
MVPPRFGLSRAVSQLELDGGAAALVPPRPALSKLREAAAGCKACAVRDLKRVARLPS